MNNAYSFRWVSYCFFCLFDFHDGDIVIRPLHPTERNASSTTPSSKTVLFEYKTPVFDPEDQRCIPPRGWRRYREVVSAAHSSCYQAWPAICMRRLWNLVRYEFQPPPSDEARRRSILAKEAGSQTESSLREQARQGLKVLVASPPVPHQIIDQRNSLVCFVVHASRPVWGRSVMIEGIRYVSYLSNNQEAKDYWQVSTQKEGRSDTIYFASNHLGVMGIFFGDSFQSKQEQPGIWWSCFTATETRPVLKGHTDGFKIRDLRLVESQYSDGIPAIRWSILPPKPRAAWIVNLDDRTYSVPYFKLLDCRKPETTGYSACMIDGDLVDLHCHTEDDDLMFYREGGGDRLHAVWLYFPIQKGERIYEVWRRRKKPHFCRDIPILRTNKGRVFVLGTYTKDLNISIEYERLTSFPTQEQARFWYSYREGCVDYLAFDTEDRRHNKNELHRPLEGPFALCSSGMVNQSFATRAALDGVVEVVPCTSWAPGSTGIVGLIFTYSDGHREAVGQIRLDHLLAPMRVDQTGDMWLGFRQFSYGIVIEALRLIHSNGKTIYGGNTSENGLRWYRVVWRGRLDWFFWYGRSFVSHHAQAVPNDHVSRILEAQGGREGENEVPNRLSSLST